MPNSRYDGDPRVVRISDTEYWLPDGDQRWTVRNVNEVWIVLDQHREPMTDEGERCAVRLRRFETADDAIAAVIGEPQ